jgi:hypothetical protein
MLVFQHTDCVNPLVPELSPCCNLENPSSKLHDLIFIMQKESRFSNTAIREQPQLAHAYVAPFGTKQLRVFT